MIFINNQVITKRKWIIIDNSLSEWYFNKDGFNSWQF